MFALLGLYSMLALSFTISKGVLQYISPVFFTGIRMSLAGLLLLGYYCYIKQKRFSIKKEHYIAFLQLAVFHVFITYVFEFWALEYVPASKDALFFNLTPFITALLSIFLCNERLTLKQWAGLFIGFIGFLPLLMAQTEVEELIGSSFISGPEILLFIAVAASAYGWIIMQKLVKNNTYEPVFVNGASMLLGGVISLIVAYATEPVFIRTTDSRLLWSQYLPMIAWYLGALILITNIFFSNLYGVLLKKYSATFMALAGGITPIFTALFDWVIWGEVITWHFIATVFFVFIGLYIFYVDELKSGITD